MSPQTANCNEDSSRDAFLGGLVYVHQPKQGRHRTGFDAVFLAAALPDKTEGRIVDLGSGVGTAGFCAAARLSEATVTLVDIDTTVLKLAKQALGDSGNKSFADRCSVLEANVTAKGQERHQAGLISEMADHVILNPPYYEAGKFRASPKPEKAEAHMLDARGLEPWIKTAADIVRKSGSISIIFRAEGLHDILNALHGRFGAIDIIPLRPRQNKPATRVIVRAIKASRAPLNIQPGLVIHTDDGSSYTPQAEQVMRNGKGLGLEARK